MKFDRGTRKISIRIDVLRNGAPITELLAKASPTVTMSADAQLKMWFSGRFSTNSILNATTDTLKPYLIIDGKDYPLGEYVISVVTNIKKGAAEELQIEAYDKGLILQQARLEERFYIKAGEGYINAIQGLLLKCGIEKTFTYGSASMFQTDREDWEVGAPVIEIINALLSEINYQPIWFDLEGIAIMQPPKLVMAENIDHTYKDDELSVITADSSSSLDIYNAPNVFIALVSNPDYKEPLMATAENNVPSNILSTISRGRRIVAPVIKLDNIASQEALQEYVDNVRNQSMIATETLEFTTANMPIHKVRDIIAIDHKRIQGIFVETGWSITMGAGALMKHKIMRVLNL